jgi:hypothetical protein
MYDHGQARSRKGVRLTRPSAKRKKAHLGCRLGLLLLVLTGEAHGSDQRSLPSLDEALASGKDLWGLAAMEQTNGPSYEFFESLLPPLRYVNAAFRHYPIVLSAPGSLQKGRLVSNGSAVNARANLNSWRDSGVPITFYVSETNEMFGQDLRRLDGPAYERRYLPIVRLGYSQRGSTYVEETFAALRDELASVGMVFTRFTISNGSRGVVSAILDTPMGLSQQPGMLTATNGSAVVWFSENWKWEPTRKALVVGLKGDESAVLAIPTKLMPATASTENLTELYEEEHRRCIEKWESVLSEGAQFETPEPRVNNAWRSLLIGLYMIQKGNSMNYSFGNAYERLYQAECGDSIRALALYGHTRSAAKAIPPLLAYTRDALKYHNAGFKLQMLSHYYWLTRDSNFLFSVRTNWTDEVRKIVEGCERDSGLFPREQYCGDIFTPVYSLHSAGAAWRGLRDFATALEGTRKPERARSTGPASSGESGGAWGQENATDLLKIAAELRQAILAATAKSEFTNTEPPFVPVALFGEEQPYDPLTATMRGSYWDLIAPYMLGSGMFGPGSARERAIIDYLQEHGGLFMGMIRFDQHSGLFANENGVDDLYGLRYTLKLLQLDQVDRALVSFYGKLAHGLTRDTFVGAEGTGLRPLDEFGRPMYLPPNSTSSAFFLWMLRHLLIQDWDMDDDGPPETLRLCFATPKRWLEDGKVIKVVRAPTCFGPVSLTISSKLSHGEVVAKIAPPAKDPPSRCLLRIRVPDGWRVTSARAGNESFQVDSTGAIDISSVKREISIVFGVQRL